MDPRTAAPDPDAFRRYVQGSGAEFSVAQGVYVETHSGWFSDRTVRYLASGKPALVQDTGFGRNYPVGEGLVAFPTPERRSPEPSGSGATTRSIAARRALSPRSTSTRIRCWAASSRRPASPLSPRAAELYRRELDGDTHEIPVRVSLQAS